MSKRPADIIISTPASKVRRLLNFDSPYASRAAVPTVRVTKARAWVNRPMNRKPRMYRMYRSPDVPRGCEGPCKVQSFESRHDVVHIGKVMCISDVTRGTGLTHRVVKGFVLSLCMFWVRYGWTKILRPRITPIVCSFFLLGIVGLLINPKTLEKCLTCLIMSPVRATVKNMHRDRYQVLRKWHATVTGGQYASKEQALVKKFVRVNNYVVYNQQEAGMRIIHTENALMLYMACTHASNPVYATLKIRIYFYDSVSN
ncbi:movement protein [Tomato leaf curl Bangladesh virus-[India:Udaipur:Gaillardia:2009]]|nr:movement protein [Tomato leaf curl Bangladesh virus-[India:Udaipur:Gaillardia:2009]]